MTSHLDELLRAALELAPSAGLHPLALAGARVFRADAPGAMVKATSAALTVGVVLQGRKRVHVGGTDFVYDARHCIVLSGESGYASQVIAASRARPYLSLTLAVPPDLVARTLVELAEIEGPTPDASPVQPPAFLARLDDGVLDPLVRLLRAMDDPSERRVLAPLALHELVFRLLRCDAAAALRHAACRGGDEARIAAVMAHMRERFATKLTVEQLAKRAGMSPSHFAHRFRDVAHVSPMRYLKHLRLEFARSLLVHRGVRAGDVATRSGYASAAHFTRDFKQHFGVSPSAYLQRLQIAGSGNTSAAPRMGGRAASA